MASPRPEHEPSQLPSGAAASAEAPSGQTPLLLDDQVTAPEANTRLELAAVPRALQDRYEFLGEIARGGMGIVYKVSDRLLGRLVALKMIRDGQNLDASFVQRFQREAQVVVRLRHPHIIEVHDFGEADGLPYYTMRLAEGGTLANRLSEFRAETARAVTLLGKVARAVEYAHQQGVLHRDLKPHNILLDRNGEPLVGDFGLARPVEGRTDLTHTGQVLGTPAYMAPEQASGRVDEVGPATDVWALGVMLHELLTGQLPFTGRNREEILYRILSEEPPRLSRFRSDLSPALETIVARCLQRDPKARYSSAGALADALERCPQARPASRSRGRILAGMLLLAMLLLVFQFLPGSGPKPADPGEPSAIELIGPRALQSQPRDLIGHARTSIEPGPDGSLVVRAGELALIELKAAAPWPDFRLEAEFRQLDRKVGEVGLFLAHQLDSETGEPRHRFWNLSVAERPGNGIDLRPAVWTNFLLAPSIMRKVPPGPQRPGNDSRRLGLELVGDSVSLLWEDRAVQTFTVADLVKKTQLLSSHPLRSRDQLTACGMGLFVYRTSATFGRVTLSRRD